MSMFKKMNIFNKKSKKVKPAYKNYTEISIKNGEVSIKHYVTKEDINSEKNKKDDNSKKTKEESKNSNKDINEENKNNKK